MRPPRDPSSIELRLDHPGGRHQVGVVAHGRGHPVDVRRLEGGDLAQRVVVELAKRDGRVLRVVERRRRRHAGSGAGDPGRADPLASMREVARVAPSRSAMAADRARSSAARHCPRPGFGRDRCRSCRRAPSPGGSVLAAAGHPGVAGCPLRREARSASSPAVADPRRDGSRVSAAYASLISAIRRVAARDAAGSSPVRSG